jgi:copper resistance protein B
VNTLSKIGTTLGAVLLAAAGALATGAFAAEVPADARDPDAYSDNADFGPLGRPRMGDEHRFAMLLVDRLEAAHSRDGDFGAYDAEAWYGRDFDRATLKAEGTVSGGKLADSRTELLWSHAVAPFWDLQAGMRHDGGEGPDREWLAAGIQGLAPYWFDLEATAYLGTEGRTALRIAGRYELLLTQRLVLEPRAETNFFGKSDPAREIGSGLSDATVGLRLRYELRRELAPYVGIEREFKTGATEDFARLAGAPTAETRYVAGLRFWF